MENGTLQVSMVGSLPVVSFFNTALSQRKVFVCQTVAGAEEQAERLRSMSHITEVEVMDAAVKETF
jgi:hypothetical protein